ncbi:MAG TPA: DUF2917 domain-containing protein [Noviherbaspirillum sp.]|nr:DUF2917 domain-containing protein [Noviherbaspirillum sp.]
MKANAQKAFAHIAHHHRDGAMSQADMELNPAGETLSLRASQHLHLRGAYGWTVRALAGTVWIAQDGDIRDVVLEAGQSIVLDRAVPALLSPMGDARISLARDAGRCTAACRTAAPASLPATAGAAFA